MRKKKKVPDIVYLKREDALLEIALGVIPDITIFCDMCLCKGCYKPIGKCPGESSVCDMCQDRDYMFIVKCSSFGR